MTEIESPFICCKHCEQRIPLRIDHYPTWHYTGALNNTVCPTSIPPMLTFKANR